MTRFSALRRVLLGTVLLAVLGLCGWVANNLVFGGRVLEPKGLPHTLIVQRGVQDSEVALVTDGLELADGAFRELLGGRVPRPVTVRLARRTPCVPFSRGNETAVADEDALCVNTDGPTWRFVSSREPDTALSIVAHELFHTVQGRLGCLPGRGNRRYAWWVEGSATYMGWRAVEHAGRVTKADVTREMRAWGGFSPELRPLESYERSIPGDPEYALAQRAVAQLVARAGTPSLLDFCAQVGAGVAWPAAFRSSFGVSVSAFYAAFEASRKP